MEPRSAALLSCCCVQMCDDAKPQTVYHPFVQSHPRNHLAINVRKCRSYYSCRTQRFCGNAPNKTSQQKIHDRWFNFIKLWPPFPEIQAKTYVSQSSIIQPYAAGIPWHYTQWCKFLRQELRETRQTEKGEKPCGGERNKKPRFHALPAPEIYTSEYNTKGFIPLAPDGWR